MSVLVVRHGLSEANNRENFGTLAFASGEAPLMAQGIEQARAAGEILRLSLGMNVGNMQVAASELKRTQQTAQEAGFRNISTYGVLNEVVHGLELTELKHMLAEKQLPKVAITAAETILENPPAESIWFTHGMVIAALCDVLGSTGYEKFIPRFCEVRELPISLPTTP